MRIDGICGKIAAFLGVCCYAAKEWLGRIFCCIRSPQGRTAEVARVGEDAIKATSTTPEQTKGLAELNATPQTTQPPSPQEMTAEVAQVGEDAIQATSTMTKGLTELNATPQPLSEPRMLYVQIGDDPMTVVRVTDDYGNVIPECLYLVPNHLRD